MEKSQIPTSSDTSNTEIYYVKNIDEKVKNIGVINPKFVLSTNKRYKNLVHCYICNIEDCQTLFKTNIELIEHKKTHINIHVCPIKDCNKSFKDIINLRKHIKKHFPTVKKYFCPFEGCGKSFTASFNLASHYQNHISKKSYKCDKCEKCFYRKSKYIYHINSKHLDINSKNLFCQHINCNHKSKTIKQKLIHHDRLEEFCMKEKNLLLNLVMIFQKSIIYLLKQHEDVDNKKETNNLKYLIDNNSDDNKFIQEIKQSKYDDILKKEYNNIILQYKVLCQKAINHEYYKDLMDERK